MLLVFKMADTNGTVTGITSNLLFLGGGLSTENRSHIFKVKTSYYDYYNWLQINFLSLSKFVLIWVCCLDSNVATKQT